MTEKINDEMIEEIDKISDEVLEGMGFVKYYHLCMIGSHLQLAPGKGGDCCDEGAENLPLIDDEVLIKRLKSGVAAARYALQNWVHVIENEFDLDYDDLAAIKQIQIFLGETDE